MKKYFIIILVLFLFPYYAYAATINSISITGDDRVYTKTSIPIKIKINVSDYGDQGLAAVVFRLNFNKYAFEIFKIDTIGIWNSELYKDDSDNYYIASSILEGSLNRCSDGLLYCGNYEVTVTFYVRDTDTIESDEIKISNIELGLLPVNYKEMEISTKDVIVVNSNQTTSKKIEINRKGAVKAMYIKPIEPSNTKPQIKNETANFKKKSSSTGKYLKSDNSYLEKLEIEGYKLKFRAITNEYNLTVKKDVNSLKIAATTMNSKAKSKIIGADNLKANNDEVKIEVTAEDGSKNTYTIKVNYEKELVLPEKKEEPKEEKAIDKKYFIIGGSILGGIVLIIIIIKSIFYIRDYKIGKQLNKL